MLLPINSSHERGSVENEIEAIAWKDVLDYLWILFCDAIPGAHFKAN